MTIKLDVEPLSSWGIKTDPVVVIAGPCSAESEEQVLETVRALSFRELAPFEQGFGSRELGISLSRGSGPLGWNGYDWPEKRPAC